MKIESRPGEGTTVVGFDDAAVLEGGFDKWSTEGRPTEAAETRYPAATLAARPCPGLFIGEEEVRAAIGDAGACTVNALAPDLHSGDNPRYGRPGHIPALCRSTRNSARVLVTQGRSSCWAPPAGRVATVVAGNGPPGRADGRPQTAKE